MESCPQPPPTLLKALWQKGKALIVRSRISLQTEWKDEIRESPISPQTAPRQRALLELLFAGICKKNKKKNKRQLKTLNCKINGKLMCGMFNVSTCCGIILAAVLALWENRASAGSRARTVVWLESEVTDGTVAGLQPRPARAGRY